MNKWADISWQELQPLFSIVMCIDQNMRVIYASETLTNYLPEIENSPFVSECFDVLRPSDLSSYSEAIKNLNSLCLMAAKSERFAIRGQLLRTRYDDEEVLCFCGAPWLFWINSHCPDIQMKMDDFSPQDVQLDQLFFMSTEKQMIADLEKFNEELTVAKNKLEAANDAQHRFFAQMSHEMRTPLNGVMSALSLMEENTGDSKKNKLVSLAKSSSQNLMDVINYVLDLSKLELAGEEGRSTFDLMELLHSAVKILKAKAKERSLMLELDVANDVPVFCLGSPSRLRQVLLNLMINAIKFTDKGSVKLRVFKSYEQENNCTLQFEIIDTGVGIPSENIELIFQPFWTAHQNDKTQVDAGTGLGLDIVRRNVEYMGGSIHIDSEPGKGSRFWFDWPTTSQSPDGQQVNKLTPTESHTITYHLTGKILLVDDNHTNLILGSMILESLGLDVITAENGKEAVSAVQEQQFDLILMDVHMPEMDGLEATHQIRHVLKQELPIIALTALSYDREKNRCLESGMNSYLTKPIIKENLAKELAKWLPSTSHIEKVDHTSKPQRKTVGVEDNLIDCSVLSELAGELSLENLEKVSKTVLSEIEAHWNDLIHASDQDDEPSMLRHIHSLSSLFRSFGLKAAGETFGSTELCLRNGGALGDGWLDKHQQLKTDSLNALAKELEKYNA